MSKKSKVEELDEVMSDDQSSAEKDMAEHVESDSNSKEQEISKEEQLEVDLAKEKDKFLRLFAEFENYKKRTSKERMDLFKTAGQEILVSLLPILG